MAAISAAASATHLVDRLATEGFEHVATRTRGRRARCFVRKAIKLEKGTPTGTGMIGADTLKEGDGMGEAERIDLNALAAGLPPYRLAEAADFIEWLKAKEDRELPPILRDAPIDDEPITPEVLAAIDAAKAETVTYSAEEMRQRYGLA